MKVFSSPSEFVAGSKASIAIGVFDGVHLGHQQVIRKAVFAARDHEGVSLVITFDKHPQSVLAPEKAPLMIYSLEQRLQTIADLGVDQAWVVPFTRDFATLSAENFISQIVSSFSLVDNICVGANFAFGSRRSGNITSLAVAGKKFGFRVDGLSSVALDGEPVSSTRIRQMIRGGLLENACQMLGSPYSIQGKVIRGARLAAHLGFPTANIEAAGITLPPYGVYAAQVVFQGQSFRGICNLGVRPTVHVENSRPLLEVNLFDFSGDLYDQTLEVIFGPLIRVEKKFPSIGDLKAQISIDVEKARASG